MARLIDADELMRDVMGLTIVSPEVMNYANAVAVAIADAPTVDAEPVRHGQWVRENSRKKSYLRLCTACGKIAYFCGEGCSYKYCPNCGAKMDGGAEDAK